MYNMSLDIQERIHHRTFIGPFSNFRCFFVIPGRICFRHLSDHNPRMHLGVLGILQPPRRQVQILARRSYEISKLIVFKTKK